VPGGFDMFHQGHLNILRAARERCDRLVVGVTSDEALIRMKGRAPVIPLKERCDLVSSLRFVDAVVVDLDQDKRLAWRLQPFDVLFKGDDWKRTDKGNALEARFSEVGVEVRYFPYTEHTFSTKLRKVVDLLEAEHDLRAAGLHPTIACEGDPSTLAPSLAITMVRILDEAVANMIKYAARDARCSVQLDVDDEQVGLLAINPLTENRQSTPATSSGLGLLGIRERAQSRGGNADVISDDHQWILHVAIPLNASVPSTP